MMEIIKKPLDIDFIKKWMNNGINPIIISILNRRGIKKEEELLNFFCPLIENIMSPFLFTDIIKSYERIDKAIKGNEKIIIFGDIDVDGTTSTAILFDFLKQIGCFTDWDIPKGDDPYGLNQNIISQWIKKKYSLCITVDCGITNIEEVKLLKDNNIDTIIIDHHEPLSKLPEAYSIINPKNEKYLKFNNIAACGVTFLFVIGYLFYKSVFFNKEIILLYLEKNKLKFEKYKNLNKIDEGKIEQTEKNIFYDSQLIYFYSDTDYIPDNLKLIFNMKLLKPVTKINDNKFLYQLNIQSLKGKISLFNLIFSKIENFNYVIDKYISLVMLATIADVMPIIDTNRILTYKGFISLKNSSNNILNTLCNRLKINPNELTSKDLSWNICPLLNAPGRMGDASKTINLFLSNSNNDTLIDEMINVNEERKFNGDKAYNLFVNNIEDNKKYYNNNITFFYSKDITKGITGITASKLTKLSNCPSIVAAKEGEYYTGSIRGETDYHFVQFLERSSNILAQFGGHKNAAGFRIHEENIDNFKIFLLNNSSLLSKINKNQTISIDAEIPVKYLDYKLINILSILEPFGEDNPNPILYTQSIEILNYYIIGKEKDHLKIYFKTPNAPFIGVFWNKAKWFQSIHKDNDKYDVTYQIEINKYNNQTVLQMLILNLAKSG